ncbi:MAG: amylo-alpha-1,6-glucosidase [Bacteroidia bacterium]|nr:amylo-alpha-1,6-glucosidase [Bacteroidia bacterium]
MRRVGRVPLIEGEWALKRELIRSTTWGGFVATTLWGCPTRKYHSWFSLWKGFHRYELMPQMQEELHLRDGRFLLTTHYFHGKRIWEGYRHLQSFQNGSMWRWVYQIGELSVEKSLYLSPTEPLWLLKYRFSQDVVFRWIPLWAARPWHTLRYEFISVERQGQRIRLPEGIELYFSVEPVPRFIPWSYPYTGSYYPEEHARGYEATETLTSAECWEWRLHQPDDIIIALSPVAPPNPPTDLPHEKTLHPTFIQSLEESAENFFLRDSTGEYILAGHPWFGVWGRDTFISLPGLTLARGQVERFHYIMETALSYLSSDGQLPNIYPDGYTAEDTGLWFIWALLQAHRMGIPADELWSRYGEAVLSVLVSYLQRLGQEDGLLHVEPFPSASWMDAVVEGRPAVERRGTLVEMNALWYAGLRFVAEYASTEGIRWRWGLLARRVLESFKPAFWAKSRGYLADWRDTEETNWQIRPNQIFTASLPYRPISEKIAELVVEVVEKHLLTPRGLRTLSPADPAYQGTYAGNAVERDRAYHNGTAWLWLLGSYADAKLSLWGDSARPALHKLLQGLEEDFYSYGWGTLAEIYDGDAPHTPRGAPAQAWSVAETLRTFFLLKAL